MGDPTLGSEIEDGGKLVNKDSLMPQFERNIEHNSRRSSISVENLISLGFRITLILIGIALLFVAAIYYGIVNP